MDSKVRKGTQEHDRDAIQKNTWGSEITVDNIDPDTPEELWGTLALIALSQITDVSKTVEEVIGRAALWDSGNNPRLPVAVLMSRVFWALRQWKPDME